ncbi:MAG: thioredoxin family protein [Winogradskyella sp.]|nr:thioredoxin family protein [Winogradskyella sp.]NNK39719.1 thioredoxin family protein [Winogradskyella sp.]
MNVLEEQMTKDIIFESLKTSMSYDQYRALVSSLVEQKSTTGNEKSEALTYYTLLSHSRMKRWDKVVKINEEHQLKIKNYTKDVTWIVITESWCGDAAHVVPVLNKIAQENEHIDLKLVLRDDNDDLMNAFLTKGSRSIPKLISVDSGTNEVLFTYGPRPSVATTMVEAFKAKHGKLTPEFKEELQHWYNKDKGQTTISDIVALLN